MQMQRFLILSYALIVFLYCAGILSWAIGQEVYRVAFASAGVSSALWLVFAVAQRMYD